MFGMRLTEIRVAGFGGQGVILSAQVIGKAAYKLAPLQTVSAKVKLSKGAVKLLGKRKRLNAVLVITTKGKGKTKTLRQKLLITEP